LSSDCYDGVWYDAGRIGFSQTCPGDAKIGIEVFGEVRDPRGQMEVSGVDLMNHANLVLTLTSVSA